MSVMHKVFGIKENVNYIDRIGAYLIPSKEGKIGVVKTPKGYFLLGGGLGSDESHEECIMRECLEEIGYIVSVGNKAMCWSYKLMKKIIIIGCPGSGKTTFAEKLQKATNLPLYYLDAIWHKPDRTHISREEYDRKLSEIFQTEEWIIDGNYSRTMEARIQNSDTIFLFDLPTEVCVQGATERLGKARYDVPWIDTTLDLKLKQEIEEFPEKVLPRIYELLEKYNDGKQITIFKSRAEADEFIKMMHK